MVLEFVRAELDSEVYRDQCVIPAGHSRADLIDQPDLANFEHNALRLGMLWYRGYPAREYLFDGFPRNVTWNLRLFSLVELGECRYANCPPWSDLAGGHRLVRLGATALGTDSSNASGLTTTAEIVSKISRRLAAGEKLATLIAVEVDGSFVLVEGHKRATAFVDAEVSRPVQIIVGQSDEFRGWRFR
jgi:hypothetical protein